jgi:enoyl-CoA hydratase/carnithine racemase
MKPIPFEQYKDKFPHVKLERTEDGILLVQLHNGAGGEFEWSFDNHHEIAYLWRDIGDDQENKVIILTGSGDAFLRREYLNVEQIDRPNMGDAAARAVEWIDAHRHGKRIEFELLEIEQPMIAALNGPCSIHAEIPLLCDVVLAAEHTILADAVHYEFGLVPGDGVQTIFPLLMGLNRARYFMITGQQMSAKECLDLGLFNEVLPRKCSPARLRTREENSASAGDDAKIVPPNSASKSQRANAEIGQPRSDGRRSGVRCAYSSESNSGTVDALR